MIPPLRSYLYVPGNRPALFEKAEMSEADAIILDMEDAVPASERGIARASIVRLLSEPRQGKQMWVRINSGDEGLEDLWSIRECPRLAGVVLAKADVSSVARVATELREGGRTIGLSPLLETAEAILDARFIAAEQGVSFLQIGEYDLAADTRLMPGEDEAELLWARMQVVFASAAAGIAAPLGAVSIDTAEPERFLDTTKRLARLGFQGRACIHPSQIAAVNQMFTTTDAALSNARRTVALLESARSRGSGVAVDERGKLVDEATVRAARSLLAVGAIRG